ncbi:MAG: GNAT family N-acetyltransferase [Cyclobacteriaceae bacterium]
MRIEPIRDNEELLSQVVRLGTKNSKTLGHFPEGAYLQHAYLGYLICAYEDNILCGYILFSITQSKSTIRIIQLCISDDFRNKGVAKSLLDSLKNKYQNSLKGIVLSCREDYKEATQLWKKYGFKGADKVRSRSKKENYLIKWWYDFGNSDLFSLPNKVSKKLKAVLDANILIKLRTADETDETGSKFLMNDWLIDEIDYYYAPEIFNEILRDKNNERARKSRSFVRSFIGARFDPNLRDQIFSQIRGIISGETENDISDKIQLSECIAAEITYFVTNDKKILEAERQISELYGVQILRPVDLILSLDQNNNKSNYLSTRIAGVNYDQSQLKSKEIEDLVDQFLTKDKHEKKHDLRNTITKTASDLSNCQVKTVRDKEGSRLAIWISEQESDRLCVPLLRTSKSKLSKTLFKQLIVQAINYACDTKKRSIVITDSFLDLEDSETLESLGFVFKNKEWTKITLSGIKTSDEIIEIDVIQSLFDKDRLIERLSSPNKDGKANLEQMLWPLKLSNLNLPAYIVPIKPAWASELFDHFAANNSMFGAKAELAWNFENVYYRSINPVSETTPGRLLWYSSSSKDKNAIRTNAIVACSYLDEVHIGEAKKLFQKFKHFGVYEWKHIYKQAKYNSKGKIKALKFSRTEVFKNPVSFARVNKILVKCGRKQNSFPSPLKISNEVFLEIYKLGTEI